MSRIDRMNHERRRRSKHLQTVLNRSHCTRAPPLSCSAMRRMWAATQSGRSCQVTSAAAAPLVTPRWDACIQARPIGVETQMMPLRASDAKVSDAACDGSGIKVVIRGTQASCCGHHSSDPRRRKVRSSAACLRCSLLTPLSGRMFVLAMQ